MEKLSFKLEVFEGPLDLLMQLIRKNKVNIYDIPIASITQQYFTVLEQMREMDLEVSSEFLVMAAQLLLIKSRMLLPKNEEEADEEDPRAELVERLLEYQRYKNATQFLAEREFSSKYLFFKQPEELEPQVLPCEEQYSIADLMAAFEDILERTSRRIPPPKKTFEGIVQREKVSVRDKVKYVLDTVNTKKRVSFAALFEGMYTKPELVATFLALLELIKMHRILANYNKKEKDFVITSAKSGENLDG